MDSNYRKTRKTHSRGSRASQPLASDVLEGTLYFVTDEGIIERSNGTIWESFSGTGSGSISSAINSFLIPVFDGEDGIDGFPGLRGLDGVAGVAGSSGAQGLRGIPGIDGIDGESESLIILASALGGLISEGLWTPTDTSGAGLTFAKAVGRWVRIGPMAFVSCDVRYPVTANGATARIGNFPFYTQGDTDVYWGGAVTFSDANVNSVNFNNNTNDTALFSYSGPGILAQTNAQMSNTTIIFNLQYHAFTV